jgi:hypothetical protein
MGTDGACGLLFCAAKRSGAFPPNMPAGLRARVSRLGAAVSRGRSSGRVEECANTDRPLHTAVPGLLAHHNQGIYIGRRFDERSADAGLSWNVEIPANINALMMVIEPPVAAADGAQHFRCG